MFMSHFLKVIQRAQRYDQTQNNPQYHAVSKKQRRRLQMPQHNRSNLQDQQQRQR